MILRPFTRGRLQKRRLPNDVQFTLERKHAIATGNYAYNAEFCHGDRFMLIGDAFAFVDPMFSSAVFLAMNSAFEGTTAVDHWLRSETAMAKKAFRRFERTRVHGPKILAWFIYRITSPAIRKIFIDPRNVGRMKKAVLSILAGDLFRDTPVGPRLIAFKFIYYMSSLSILLPPSRRVESPEEYSGVVKR